MKTSDAVWSSIVCLLIGAVVGLFAGSHLQLRQDIQDVIQAGVGEYRVDSKTGETSFVLTRTLTEVPAERKGP